jgi:hypothetical protein
MKEIQLLGLLLCVVILILCFVKALKEGFSFEINKKRFGISDELLKILKKTAEELRRLMELRRSNAASSVPNKKKYNRKKCQSLMLELKKESE